jgi:hypothetical protein
VSGCHSQHVPILQLPMKQVARVLLHLHKAAPASPVQRPVLRARFNQTLKVRKERLVSKTLGIFLEMFAVYLCNSKKLQSVDVDSEKAKFSLHRLVGINNV